MFCSKSVTHVVFHDDVDGIVSSAIFLKFGLEDDFYRLYPVSSSNRGKNFISLIDSMCLDKNDKLIILDYEYHNRSNLWIDHHYNPDFGSPSVFNNIVNYDPGRLSAASIIADKYNKNDTISKDLIESVDVIDSAGYPDINWIFYNESPIMILRSYLEKIIPHDMSYCRLSEVLCNCNMDIEKALFIMKIDTSYVKIVRDEAAKSKDHLVINGDMSILRQRRPGQFPRYSELLVKPDIRYTIRLTKVDGQNVYFQIGYNRWHKKQNNINIGKSLSKIKFLNKAGGHFHVGGGIVKEIYVEKLLDELCYLFNREESMEKYGVDQSDPVEKKASEMVKEGSEINLDDARESAIDNTKVEGEENVTSEE